MIVSPAHEVTTHTSNPTTPFIALGLCTLCPVLSNNRPSRYLERSRGPYLVAPRRRELTLTRSGGDGGCSETDASVHVDHSSVVPAPATRLSNAAHPLSMTTAAESTQSIRPS